jgi:hypothetical protein
MLRRVLHSSLLAFVVFAPFSLSAATTSGSVEVVAVQSTRVADLVLLARGLDAGLRQGMVCSIARGSTDIAEIILVDSRLFLSAALIVTLAPGQSIQTGDVASVKILKV